MIKKSFFCENCRVGINSISNLYYVEENSDRGFCSEECIKEFYRPIMRLCESEEHSFRDYLNFEAEDDYLHYFSNQELLDQAIHNPHELWELFSETEQRFMTHILKFKDQNEILWIILVCSHIESEAAFVFYRTITKHESLVNKYRRDRKIVIEKEQIENNALEISPHFLEMVEGKKSMLLAELLGVKHESDIDFERYVEFEKFIAQTISEPDEIYVREDEEEDEIYTYIKSFKENELTFFYIVLGYKYEAEGKTQMIPALGFPSVKQEVYTQYAQGESVKDKIKN